MSRNILLITEKSDVKEKIYQALLTVFAVIYVLESLCTVDHGTCP